MNIEVWTAGRPVETGHPVLTAAAVALLLVLAFVAGRKTHGHVCRTDGGCPKCDAVYELGYDAGFEAGVREATVDWKEWR